MNNCTIIGTIVPVFTPFRDTYGKRHLLWNQAGKDENEYIQGGLGRVDLQVSLS